MNDAKYIGLDVHQATISVAVRDSRGNLVMEAVLETEAETILQFIRGLRGSLSVTFEEGTWAAWLHDLLQPHVTRVVVCDPRKNALLKVGNKNDRIDARKLSELLYLNKLSPVYHGAPGIRTLKELARSYIAMTRDLTRVMSRLKAIYRRWAIPCANCTPFASIASKHSGSRTSTAFVRKSSNWTYAVFCSLRDELRKSATKIVSRSLTPSTTFVAASGGVAAAFINSALVSTCLKNPIFCTRPSLKTSKSSSRRSSTRFPLLSVTTVGIMTRLVFTLIGDCFSEYVSGHTCP
jgi:hypothetical protein